MIVLGSASPRRREILTQLRVPHEVIAPDIDETPRAGEDPIAYLQRMAREKLADVSARARGRLVLAADTTVLVDGAIFGKPATDEEARAMLARLSDRAHQVITAFALGDGARLHEARVETRVVFRALSEEDIEGYVRSGEGRDKAGAYAVQGFGAMLVSRIEGSYTNVVGLPACEVFVALRSFGAV